METTFPKSISFVKKHSQLKEIVKPSDTLGILIDADPDSMKRIFWKKAKHVEVYRINSIERADNVAFVKFLTVDQKHIRYLKLSVINKWALVDSQPYRHKLFMNYQYDIIIDHHPVSGPLKTDSHEKNREEYEVAEIEALMVEEEDLKIGLQTVMTHTDFEERRPL